MVIQVTIAQMEAFEDIKRDSFKYIPAIRIYFKEEETGIRLRPNASASFLLRFEDIKSLSSLKESDRIDAVRKLVDKKFRTITFRYIEHLINLDKLRIKLLQHTLSQPEPTWAP